MTERRSSGVVSSPTVSQYHPYPPPLAKYEEVIANPKLFKETLEKLHSTMGTKFMVPIIGGKELDLHRLFVEVTSRGGVDKIINDRRWKEVTAVFNFPSTATNASFVLRKYYFSLLHHYEKIYFFGAQGWNFPSATASSQPSSLTPNSGKRTIESSYLRLDNSSANKRPSGPTTNYPVIGVIDGKFEHGYLVTVNVGQEKLKGVLYHTPDSVSPQVPRGSGSIINNNTCDPLNMGIRLRRRRRKKSEMRKRDPSHPKPNRSGYNFFFAEQHSRLKPLHPGKDREISKMIGDLWNKLTETEKAVYQEKGVKDKERYRSEMVEYREKLKAGIIISDAVPIQQRPAEPEIAMTEEDAKMDAEEEGDLPLALQNDSSSDGSDSEDKTAEKDLDLETSPEAEVIAEESDNVTMDASVDGEGFELRRRGPTEKGSEAEESRLEDDPKKE
ncbi:High mobility group B protein 15 [Acorus calamus]|uniref:High mobility group B protein 15 n=1 Tax=Acorus calamus TaxID=4465 RepID=A0AAV9D0K9_ACOCL|nr:High mobility group B protein 15 [Acorus calamus]